MRVRVMLRTGMTREVPLAHFDQSRTGVSLYQPTRGVEREFIPWHEIRLVQHRPEPGEREGGNEL